MNASNSTLLKIKTKATKSLSKEKDIYSAAHHLAPKGYYCNITSIYYHGLTNQVPSVVYMCKESIGNAPRSRPDKLSDFQIRKVFIKGPRLSKQIYQNDQGKVVLIAREKGSDIGVIALPHSHTTFPADSRITSLERCLIDAVVAPHYNGGLPSLMEFFENAADQLDVKKIVQLYQHSEFLYPFHQSLGFFLAHSGQKQAADLLYDTLPPTNRFFVDRAAKSTWKYNKRWQVHYPEWLLNED